MNIKKYISIDFLAGTLDEAITTLLSYKAKGEFACLEFKGVTLYSDTVEIDKAYKEIKGMTKLEFDKILQERNDCKKSRKLSSRRISE